MKRKILIFLSICLFLFSTHDQLLSQMCSPATGFFPGSPFYSVDPPIFRFTPAQGNACNFIEIGNTTPDWCYFFSPPGICQNGQVPPSDSCMLISNSRWNTCYLPNTQYCWRIHTNGAGNTWQLGGTDIRRLPAALPTVNLIYPSNGATGVLLTPMIKWNHIDSAANYTLCIYTDKCCIYKILDSNTISDSLQVPSGRLSSNTMYYWRVKPFKTSGEGPFSDPYFFTTAALPSPPAPPVLVSPLNNTTGMPLTDTLVWNISSSASTYRLQVAVDAGFTSLILNDSTLTNTSRIVSGLSQLTTYYWRVNAKNSAGTSGWSSVWNFRTKGSPTQVTLYVPINNAINIPTTYTFRWSKAFDQTTRLLVSNYWFEMVTDTILMANLLRDSTLTDTSRVVTGMSNSTSYFWRVKAKNEIGWGNFAVWFKFTTVPTVPAAPVLIAPPNNSSGQSLTPLLDWSAVTGAASYRVQVTTDSAFAVITALDSSNVVGDSLRIPAGRLSNNIKYFWRVNATNTGGTGPWSAAWNFRVGYIGLTQFGNEIPKEYKLYYNYPNPFNPNTLIKFDIPRMSFTNLTIYDILGREVAALVNEQLQPGTYEVEWDAGNNPSGVYFYRLDAGAFTETRKMLLIK